MNIFILEDDLTRIDAFITLADVHNLTIRTSVAEARKAWKPPYDIVCLDHDLGGETFVSSELENTGAGFVRDLVQSPKVHEMAKAYIVHSWNPDGAKLMVNLLVNAKCQAMRHEFGFDLIKKLRKMGHEL